MTTVRSMLSHASVLIRTRTRELADDMSVAIGRALTRAGTNLLLYPHRGEHVALPTTTEVDERPVDIVEDLVEYTGLERDHVEALIRRRHESFRAEWHTFPLAIRDEGWFYLSSRTYLFANAVHGAEDLAEDLNGFLPESRRVLDFGGGTGNLALALAARGHRVDFVERSALQKDFVRFRVEKYGLEARVRVLDQWKPLARQAYDLICAFDVLEHIEELEAALLNMLSATRPGGMLAESSPFVRNTWNPMHHEMEADFVRVMQREGFSRAHESERFRLWRADASASPV